MARIYWRGRSLWLDIPNKGKRIREFVIKRISDAKSEKRRCEELGIAVLGKSFVQLKEGTIFEKKKEKYNPKFWRLVGRYWWFHLRFQRSGKIERVRINLIVKRWGHRFATQIGSDEVELWINKSKLTREVSTVNRMLAYFSAVYNYSKNETRRERRIVENPAQGIKKLKGEKVRKYLLDQITFERCLRAASPAFKPLWLAAWETGRRPEELKSLTWDMVDLERRLFLIPAHITKTDQDAMVPISDRLFNELVKIADFKNHVF